MRFDWFWFATLVGLTAVPGLFLVAPDGDIARWDVWLMIGLWLVILALVILGQSNRDTLPPRALRALDWAAGGLFLIFVVLASLPAP